MHSSFFLSLIKTRKEKKERKKERVRKKEREKREKETNKQKNQRLLCNKTGISNSRNWTKNRTFTSGVLYKSEAAICDLVRKNGRITRREVESECGFGLTKSYRILKTMCEKGLLKQNKNDNQTVYTLL